MSFVFRTWPATSKSKARHRVTSFLCVEWCRGAESLNPDSSGLRTGSLLTWWSGFNPALYQYRSKIKGPTMGTLYSGWCRGAELNRRHADFQSAALPTELPRHVNDMLTGACDLQDVPIMRTSNPRFFLRVRICARALHDARQSAASVFVIQTTP